MTSPDNTGPLTVVILTALPVEFNAVLGHITERTIETHEYGTLYHVGRYETQKDSWRVVLAEVGQHNDQAALEAERAFERYKPELALFVGIAGGIKDVSVGDVVVASKVLGYEGGKSGTTFLPRGDSFRPSY